MDFLFQGSLIAGWQSGLCSPVCRLNAGLPGKHAMAHRAVLCGCGGAATPVAPRRRCRGRPPPACRPSSTPWRPPGRRCWPAPRRWSPCVSPLPVSQPPAWKHWECSREPSCPEAASCDPCIQPRFDRLHLCCWGTRARPGPLCCTPAHWLAGMPLLPSVSHNCQCPAGKNISPAAGLRRTLVET